MIQSTETAKVKLMSLITQLQNPALYDHPVASFELIETHISWVLLTGEFAYKIKKPVNFGFLDFSALEKRRYYCNEEIRLNQRLAPQLYLDVLSINGTEDNPAFNGEGAVIEYAIKMRQFPQSAQLDRLLNKNGLDNAMMDQLAEKIADFHLGIEWVDPKSAYGNYESIQQPVQDNFSHIRKCINDDSITPLLGRLEQWSNEQLEILQNCIQQRKQQGFVRECHGDMHLRNIALWNNEILIFDCIEFNENFYWIDVISEIAFLIMDLEDRQQAPLARRFLNRYLEITGDYEGLRLLNFYKVYRAMVRAKVDALRVEQEIPGSPGYNETLRDFRQYLELAESYIRPVKPCLLINYGVSGSGKSAGTLRLLEKFPAVRIRSDVERKRIFNVKEGVNTSAAFEQSIYTPEATTKTYDRLETIAHALLELGYSVVIDAANLKYKQRQRFSNLAKNAGVDCRILFFTASDETLRERVVQRAKQGNDVSDATLDILERQLKTYEPLREDELAIAIEINTEKKIDLDELVREIRNAKAGAWEDISG